MESQRTAERLFEALSDVYRAMRASAQRWDRLGIPLRRPDLVLMRYLQAHGERRLTELAERMCVSPSVVSRQIAALESDGLLTRRPDPADARAGLVSLTDAGLAALDEVTAVYTRHLSSLVTRWSDEDAERAIDFMEGLAEVIIADLDHDAVPA